MESPCKHSLSSSGSSLDSLSSSLLSDSSDSHSDTSSSIERHHHRYRSKHHRKRRRHSYRHRHSSMDSWVADMVVSCAPPIPRHLRRNLKQVKYVNFTSLLLPMDPPPLVPGKQQQRGESSHSMRSFTDQQTWLEAWNRYASARIAYDPDIALSLVKYQTLMAMLFRQFTPKASIEYDRLFCQAAGQDAYLPWDCLNNQIFVYTFTPAHAHTPEVRDQTSPFAMPSSSQFKIDSSNGITPFVSTIPFTVTAPFTPTAPFGTLASSWPETAHHSHPALTHYQDQTLLTMSPMMHLPPKFASSTTSGSALSLTACMPTCAGRLAATGHTQAKGVPNAPNELGQARTPVQHAQF